MHIIHARNVVLVTLNLSCLAHLFWWLFRDLDFVYMYEYLIDIDDTELIKVYP